MEDDRLVELYLSRDEDAIRFSSEKYGTRLRALSMSITSDYQTSEECENGNSGNIRGQRSEI